MNENRNPEHYADVIAETKQNSRWRREPFVLFVREVKDDKGKVHKRVHRLKVGLMHGSTNDIQYYLNKGFIIADFWIPTSSENAPPSSKRNGIVVDHGWGAEIKTEEGRIRLREIKQLVTQAMHGNAAEVETQKKISTLEEKLALAEAKLGKQNNGK